MNKFKIKKLLIKKLKILVLSIWKYKNYKHLMQIKWFNKVNNFI